MYLESLMKLAEIADHYKTNNKILIDPDFQQKTEELIAKQSEILAKELEFRKDHPGPYNFGFGDLVFTIFSPEHTGEQEWAMIARKNKWQKAYRFNTVMTMVKTLVSAVEESSKE
jgi:hypothetical protein